MSPQEVEPLFRHRGRSNTNSFTNFPWRRGRNDPPTIPPAAPEPTLSVDELIAALTPPAVPSLATARALSAALANASNVQLFSLAPILASLCTDNAPASLRAAGYDILTAFLERIPAPPLAASDRIALFSLFPADGQNAWNPDVWEARFRAFTAFTREGAEIAGIEPQLLEMLQTWIDAAFSGLLTSPRDVVISSSGSSSSSFAERAERERSVDVLGSFLTVTTSRLETLARLGEPTIGNVLSFLGGLVERALALPSDPPLSAYANPDILQGPHSSIPPTPTRTSHRRHHSSTSIPLSSPVAPSPLGPTPRRPADIAVALYLDHLDAQARYLSPVHLKTIIPTLFRCLASYASQLPRLSLSSIDQFDTQFPLERHIVKTATGACRTLRIYVRRALCTRLARSYISRMNADSFAHSTLDGISLEQGLMERAWSKDEFTRGDLGKVGRMLRRAAEAWVSVQPDGDGGTDSEREEVLLEIAGALRDIFQEYDERADSSDVEVGEDETNVVGETLLALARYISPLRNADGNLFIVPLTRPSDAPTSFLRSLSALLSRDHTSTPCNPYLSTILLSVAEHLVDSDTAHIINVMFERGDLSPIAHDWLANWSSVLSLPEISSVARPLTRTALLDALQAVSATVRDVPMHRQPLVDLVMDFCVRQDYRKGERDGYEVVWNILADELVLRTIEAQEKEKDANAEDADKGDLTSTFAAPAQTYTAIGTVSSNVSPVLARGQFDYPGVQRDRSESSAIPGVMSLFSSLATGGSTSGAAARSQAPALPRADDSSSVNIPLSASEPLGMPAALGAVVALVHIFAQLAFTPYSLSDRNRTLAVRVFRILVGLVSSAKSARARLAILQFFFRLRVDRDHRLYSVYGRYDRLGSIAALAGLICRVGVVEIPASSGGNEQSTVHEEPATDPQEILRARARAPERNGRHASRDATDGPLAQLPNRQLTGGIPSSAEAKPRKPIWAIPESLPFTIPESDTPSDGLISYDPHGPGNRVVLPIISDEKDWEILSYSRAAISKLLTILCSKVSQGDLASGIVNWPTGLKPRDAQGLACYSLSVLISYRGCFEPAMQHVLVEVLIAGLSGQPSTIKACLQALSLSAFELPNSMKRFLPNILTKLSQIMTNASMAMHIIDFLAIDDFRLVFGVALQYLQTSWALSQHLRVMSYYIVYLWFLGLKLVDRPRHVKYITRQLLLANGGQEDIDEPAEVCFDWLARYTYASADPRPANSMLNDIVMNPVAHQNSPESMTEKSWIVGNALVTIRALPRIGWVEVTARRASGLTRILARIENVPMVGPGEVDPDCFPSHHGYVWQGSAPSQRRKEVAIDPSFFALQLSQYGRNVGQKRSKVVDTSGLPAFFRTLDRMPVIDTHKVGIMYVAPGQTDEREILANSHGSPAYTRFSKDRSSHLFARQVDVYAGGLDPDEDGEYAYAWWDDIGQILYHTATMMPNHEHDPHFNYKKRHIGNDLVRIVWNDSGKPYRFDTLSTQFQFVNIRAPGMSEFTPIGNFKLISAENLPLLVRQLSLLADWFAAVFQHTQADTVQVEVQTNWRARLQAIKRFPEDRESFLLQESSRDFTVEF
ncbi:hypothetical protein BJV77DRAFT_1060291 [Russula vinacea]|nr:hypothetical protein BJV77DRAFT_1060291 [Russula vinacea]